MNNLIKLNNLKKTFKLSNKDELLLLENLNLNIYQNTITSIIAPSGCGKSTLLNILGLLDSNFNGKYLNRSSLVIRMSESWSLNHFHKTFLLLRF